MWQEFTYSSAAGKRQYFVYTPASYQIGAAVPLVMMLHGCQQTALNFAIGTRMNQLADQHNFIVAYPQQASSANIGGCWNWFLTANQQRGQGEPALIAGIVDAIQQNRAQWSIDARRVYVAGMSAGGALAAILGATYPDIFAAVGVHSGVEYGAARNQIMALQAMRLGGPDPLGQGQAAYTAMGDVARVVPTIVFHGTNDNIIAPINGDQVIQQWMETDQLASNGAYRPDFANPASTTTGQVTSGYSYTTFLWNDSHNATVQSYWKVSGLGHAWAGGDPAGSFTDPLGPDASAAFYAFFTQQSEENLPLWRKLTSIIRGMLARNHALLASWHAGARRKPGQRGRTAYPGGG